MCKIEIEKEWFRPTDCSVGRRVGSISKREIHLEEDRIERETRDLSGGGSDQAEEEGFVGRRIRSGAKRDQINEGERGLSRWNEEIKRCDGKKEGSI